MKSTDNQQEIFIVVDKNDTIVGFKTRYECHHDPSLIHRVVGVAIMNDKGEILLQKRSMTKDMDAGMWGISVAGHVEKEQSYEDAIHREMKEELGIEASIVPVAKFIVHGTNETEMASFFTAIHNGPFTINPDEIDRVEFFIPTFIQEQVIAGNMIVTEGTKENLRLLGLTL